MSIRTIQEDIRQFVRYLRTNHPKETGLDEDVSMWEKELVPHSRKKLCQEAGSLAARITFYLGKELFPDDLTAERREDICRILEDIKNTAATYYLLGMAQQEDEEEGEDAEEFNDMLSKSVDERMEGVWKRSTLKHHILSAPQVAIELGISVVSVRKAIKEGKLVGFREGPHAHYKIPAEEVERYKKQRPEYSYYQ